MDHAISVVQSGQATTAGKFLLGSDFPHLSRTHTSEDFKMELAISAVTGDLVSRFISFLMNKFSSRVCSEEKVQRLQQLLLRVHTVVEEADGRYITNSHMLIQLKTIAAAMYRGYHVLDTIKYRQRKEGVTELVSDSSSLSFANPLKRPCTIAYTATNKVFNPELQTILENLEAVVANMTEFLILLGGCERMSRRPYDAYLYTDNFMFGRHTEKQKVLNFLLQRNPPGAPAVLPIIGGHLVGKKTLVAHVCHDERVRLHFSSILHLNGDNFLRILDHERTMSRMMLVVVEFASDVDDEDWKTFYSFITRTMSKASKVIIVSKLERSARFGSVKPIFLNMLSYEEFRYLFKTLAFGSADPAEHPQLVQVAEEFAKVLRLESTLLITNAVADVFKRNLNVQVWLSVLNRHRRVIEKNLTVYGGHPKLLFEQGHRVEITDFALHPVAPLRTIPCPLRSGPCTSNGSRNNISVKKELSKVTLGELLANPSVTPKEEFNLLAWESRILHLFTLFKLVHKIFLKVLPCQGGSVVKRLYNLTT